MQSSAQTLPRDSYISEETTSFQWPSGPQVTWPRPPRLLHMTPASLHLSENGDPMPN